MQYFVFDSTYKVRQYAAHRNAPRITFPFFDIVGEVDANNAEDAMNFAKQNGHKAPIVQPKAEVFAAAKAHPQGDFVYFGAGYPN